MSESVDPSEGAFLQALFGEDELGVMVRVHIHIEAMVRELLERLVPHPSALQKLRLDYAQCVHLAEASLNLSLFVEDQND